MIREEVAHWSACRGRMETVIRLRLGVRLTVAAVHNTFPELIREAGLEGRGHRAGGVREPV